MTSLIDIVLDEIWIFILSEWIGKQETLLALDDALTNRVARERYISWMKHSKTVLLSIRFLVPKSHCSRFVSWCDKRNTFPRDIYCSICFCNNALFSGNSVLKLIEHADIQFCTVEEISMGFVLAAFPICETIHFQNFELDLSFSCCIPTLKEVEFTNGYLPTDLVKWKEFSKYCPNINSLKFTCYVKFYRNILIVLMNHLSNLSSVSCTFFRFSYVPRLLEDLNTNDCITELYFHCQLDLAEQTNIDGWEDELIIPFLRKCPNVRSLSLKNIGIFGSPTPPVQELISTCWTHLQSVCLKRGFFVHSSDADSFFGQLASTCHASLQYLEVVIEESFENVIDAAVLIIARSFPNLLTLTIVYLTSDGFDETMDFSTQFANAPFQTTLTSLNLLFPLHYSFAGILPSYISLKQLSLNLVPNGSEYEQQPQNPSAILFGCLPYAQQLKLVSITSTKFSFRCFFFFLLTNLSDLTISDVRLYPEELRVILQLPKLTILSIGKTYSIKPITLFKESSYPSKIPQMLAPLQKLDLYKSDIRFTEHKITLLLQRFPALRTLRLGEIMISKKAFQMLQYTYRHRVEIVKLFSSPYLFRPSVEESHNLLLEEVELIHDEEHRLKLYRVLEAIRARDMQGT